MSQPMSSSQRIPPETLAGFEKTNLPANALQKECATIVGHLKDYVRENPGNAALWCFGVGFVLGWRLKPW